MSKTTLSEYIRQNGDKEVSQEVIKQNILSDEDLKYNQNIEKTWDIYGTYRSKKMKSDKWDHKYGALDNKFRLNIKSYIDSDQRKVTTGKWIGSYNIKELKDLALQLGISIIDSWQKEDLGEAIEKFLKENNRILK